jgi:hypothetical protein
MSSNLNVRNFDRSGWPTYYYHFNLSWLFSMNGDETTWLAALQLPHRSLPAQSTLPLIKYGALSMQRRCPAVTHIFTTNKLSQVMRLLRSLQYTYYWYRGSSGNNKNVFRCSGPINHAHPDISVSVCRSTVTAPWCLHVTSVTMTWQLAADPLLHLAPCWTLNVHTT